MKRKIFTAIMAFSIATATVSCGDDFVTNEPVYYIGSDNYFNTEEEYYTALIAAYDILQSTYVNVILGEIASDNTLSGGGDANDVIGWQQVDDMIHTPVNSNLRDVWNWMYAGVNRASYIIEFKDRSEFQGKAQIIAEARFLRAYYHFELVKWFGAIPMKGDARFKLGDELTIPRSPVEDVYASIENDLTLAIADLNPVAPQVGRITKGAAQALLGKVYLYQNKKDLAGPMLENVINSGLYQLTKNSNTAPKDKYDNMFEEIGENGIESIFEVQYTDVEGAGFDCLQCSEGNVAVGFSGPRNYEGPLFTKGFSFNVPTLEALSIYEAGDMRRDMTILDMRTWTTEADASYTPGHKDTQLFNRKYIPRVRSENAAGDQNLTNPNNYRAIRYADVLLMAAEAYAGTNDAKAREYVNEVRERAFGNTSQNLTSSGAELAQDIQDERRRELLGEGHRFFDLVRTGKAAGAIPGFTAGKNEVFPIPFEEIQFSNGNWQQNPQYIN